MTKKEMARDLVQTLNIINDLAKEKKDNTDPEVRVWLDKYFVDLVNYHSVKEKENEI